MQNLADDPRIHVIDHPMVQHKLTILRDKNTGSKKFRELARELAMFEAYEATRHFELTETTVETPICEARSYTLKGKKVAIIPILRAGLGMVEGVVDLIPAARVGHIGLYRDPTTHQPVTYYCKLPSDISEREVLIVDPMLATGGSASAAIGYLREAGARSVRLLVIIAAPEGLRVVLDADPDVEVFTCCIDDHLNENAYIVPGLGDAGDRIFGTR